MAVLCYLDYIIRLYDSPKVQPLTVYCFVSVNKKAHRIQKNPENLLILPLVFIVPLALLSQPLPHVSGY